MRISDKTIDRELMDKINELDMLKGSYVESGMEQFVIYDGDSLKLRELDTNPLDEVIRFSDIEDMKNGEYKNDIVDDENAEEGPESINSPEFDEEEFAGGSMEDESM